MASVEMGSASFLEQMKILSLESTQGFRARATRAPEPEKFHPELHNSQFPHVDPVLVRRILEKQ